MVNTVLTASNLIYDNNISNQTITILRLRNKLETYISHLKSLTLHNIFFNPRYHEENGEIHYPFDQDAELSNIRNYYAIKLKGLDAYLNVHFALDFKLKKFDNFQYRFEINKINCKSLPAKYKQCFEDFEGVKFLLEHKGTLKQSTSQNLTITYLLNNQKHGEFKFHPQKDGIIDYEINLLGVIDSITGSYKRSECNIRNRFDINDKIFLLINHENQLDTIEIYYRLNNIRQKICSIPITL
ncbi:hypothetical protein KBD45_05215 [Candidatus Dojkabacteria bacterium]|nr:hypothetical protein [Candidatus Dojkabacteria bacterium]